MCGKLLMKILDSFLVLLKASGKLLYPLVCQIQLNNMKAFM